MIETTIDRKLDITLHVCTGIIDYEQLVQAVEAFYTGKPTMHLIWDFTDADISSLTTDHIRMLATLVKNVAHSRVGGKTAIVAGQNITFGMARMYQILAQMMKQIAQVEVFRDLNTARVWILE